MACGIAIWTHTCPLDGSRTELRAGLRASRSACSSCIHPSQISASPPQSSEPLVACAPSQPLAGMFSGVLHTTNSAQGKTICDELTQVNWAAREYT